MKWGGEIAKSTEDWSAILHITKARQLVLPEKRSASDFVSLHFVGLTDNRLNNSPFGTKQGEYRPHFGSLHFT